MTRRGFQGQAWMKVVGTEARLPSGSSAVMLAQVTTDRQLTQKPLFGPEHHQCPNTALSLYSDMNLALTHTAAIAPLSISFHVPAGMAHVSHIPSAHAF